MRPAQDIVAEFLRARHAEGVILPHSYFWELFGLEEPRGRTTVDDVHRADMAYASAILRLGRTLLEDHQMDLQNVFGEGYRLVPYVERVPAAIADTRRGLRRTLRQGTSRLNNIPNPEQLDYTQRRLRDRALTTFDMVRHAINKRRFSLSE